MFNIKYRGKYIKESQLNKDKLPSNAVIFKEPNSITSALLLGSIISLPIMICMTIGLVLKIGSINNIKLGVYIALPILVIILSLLHEIIHGLCFPKEFEKEIWVKFNEGALFVYCNKQVSKKRFIWVCVSPNLILGFIPFLLFIIGVFDFNNNISNLVGLISWSMTLGGIGDYLNIYNAVKQVPKNAYVFNYGFHSFWIE